MQSVITILFRGLLVFHQIGGGTTGQPAAFEVGLLPEQGHFARIMTFRDGVHESTRCLFPEPPGRQNDCIFPEIPQMKQVLQLRVDDPVSLGVTTRQTDGNEKIDRKNHQDKQDFRWILNIENSEFPYGNLSSQLDLSKLAVVITIPAGEFYTKLRSTALRRRSSASGDADFGPVAGVIGCEIKVRSGGAGLFRADQVNPVFSFNSERSDPGITYVIANSPPDTETMRADHFQHYYELFKRQPGEKFYFSDPSAYGRGPNPALCGAIYLGQSSDSLMSSTTLTRGPARQVTPGKKRRPRPSSKRTRLRH